MSDFAQKKFSIIVPVYNVDKYIKETIESFLSQDIPENEYEIICVNDGSTDDSEKVISSLKSLHANIVLYTQENAGVSAARNKGIELAQGEYIWFIDGDDLILPNCLKHIYRIMKDSHAESFLFRSKHFVEEPKYVSVEWKYEHCNDYDKILEFMEYNGGAGVCGNIFKTAFLIENEIYFNNKIKFSEDVLYNFRTLLKMEIAAKTDEAFLYIRDRQDSVIHTSHLRLGDHAKSMNMLIDEYDTLYVAESNVERKELCLKKRYGAVKALLFDLMRIGNIQEAKKQIKDLKNRKYYPYPLQFNSLLNNGSFRNFAINFISFLFPCKLYFYCTVRISSILHCIRRKR